MDKYTKARTIHHWKQLVHKNINLNTILGVLIIILLSLLVIKETQPRNIETKVASPTPTSTPYPTVTPRPSNKSVAPVTAPIATPRNKVPVTITEPGSAGTYYCYEDKANELAMKQTSLNLLHKSLDFCADQLQYEINQCDYSDPSGCPTGTECNSKSEEIMTAQNELWQMIKTYCP